MDVVAIVGPTGVGMFLRGFLFCFLCGGFYIVLSAVLAIH